MTKYDAWYRVKEQKNQNLRALLGEFVPHNDNGLGNIATNALMIMMEHGNQVDKMPDKHWNYFSIDVDHHLLMTYLKDIYKKLPDNPEDFFSIPELKGDEQKYIQQAYFHKWKPTKKVQET